MRGHPADGFERDDSKKSRSHKGADAGEEEEQAHYSALHGARGCGVGELQTYKHKKMQKPMMKV